MTEVAVHNIKLVPVLELEPATFSTTSRTSPSGSISEFPNEWNRYWMDSLADSGITGVRPIRVGSWHVMTSQFDGGPMLEPILRRWFEELGGVETLNDPECRPWLSGGLALFNGADLLVEPQCCSELGDFGNWRAAASYRAASWQMLWIGHPWLSVRFENSWLIFSEPHEQDEPVEKWKLKPADLLGAVAAAERELIRFSAQVENVLRLLGFRGDAQSLARKLAGLDNPVPATAEPNVNTETNERLNRLVARVFALNNELNEATGNADGDAYLEKWRALHKLKEEYKRLTGIYPILPATSGESSSPEHN